jgi:hypothetical protein
VRLRNDFKVGKTAGVNPPLAVFEIVPSPHAAVLTSR